MSESLEQIKTDQDYYLKIEKLKELEQDLKLLPSLLQSSEKYSKKIADLRAAYLEIQTKADQSHELIKIENFHRTLCQYLSIFSRSIENEIHIRNSNHFYDLIMNKMEAFNKTNKFASSIEIISRFENPLKLIKSMQTSYEETQELLNELSKEKFLHSTFSDKVLVENLFSRCDLKANSLINQDQEKGNYSFIILF